MHHQTCRTVVCVHSALAATVFFLGWNRRACAADAFNVMDPVQVTAARVSGPAVEAPGALDVIPVESMTRRGMMTTVEALRDLAGISTRSVSGNAAQTEIALRGFGENAQGRVLVLQDGRRFNSPEMTGIPWMQSSLGQIDRIEVLRGAQSVLYGNHAIAGVINIVGRDPTPETETRLMLLGGSFSTLSALAATEGRLDDTAFQVGADYHTTDGYRDRSGYEAWNLYGDVTHMFGDLAPLTLRVNAGEITYELPGYLTRAQMKADPRQSLNPADEARLRDLGLRMTSAFGSVEDVRFETSAGLSRRTLETDVPSWMSFVDSDIDAVSFSPRLSLERVLFGYEHRWLIGADTAFDRLDADRYADTARDARSVSARLERLILGVYVLDDVALDEALTLRVGARGEQSRTTAEVRDDGGMPVDDSQRHSVAVWEIGLRYHPSDRLRLFARGSSLYRYPFLDEQVSYYGFGFDQFYRDLDPETGFSMESGASLRLGGGARVEINAFQIAMRDEIAYNALTGINENLDRTRRRGAESAIEWRREGWGGASLRYAWTQSRFTRGEFRGETVPLVPAHRVSLNAEMALPAGCAFQTVWHFTDSQRMGGDNTGMQSRLAAFATLDLGVRCVPPAQPNLQVFVGLQNALDKSYADVAYAGMMDNGFYPSAGRAWKATASYRF